MTEQFEWENVTTEGQVLHLLRDSPKEISELHALFKEHGTTISKRAIRDACKRLLRKYKVVEGFNPSDRQGPKAVYVYALPEHEHRIVIIPEKQEEKKPKRRPLSEMSLGDFAVEAEREERKYIKSGKIKEFKLDKETNDEYEKLRMKYTELSGEDFTRRKTVPREFFAKYVIMWFVNEGGYKQFFKDKYNIDVDVEELQEVLTYQI